MHISHADAMKRCKNLKSNKGMFDITPNTMEELVFHGHDFTVTVVERIDCKTGEVVMFIDPRKPLVALDAGKGTMWLSRGCYSMGKAVANTPMLEPARKAVHALVKDCVSHQNLFGINYGPWSREQTDMLFKALTKVLGEQGVYSSRDIYA